MYYVPYGCRLLHNKQAGSTPLHMAVPAGGQADIAELLIMAGADVNAADEVRRACAPGPTWVNRC